MNTSENMKTLLETVDKIEEPNVDIGDSNDNTNMLHRIQELTLHYGMKKPGRIRAIEKVYRSAYIDGIKNSEPDLKIIDKILGGGSEKFAKVLKFVYNDGFEDGENARSGKSQVYRKYPTHGTAQLYGDNDEIYSQYRIAK